MGIEGARVVTPRSDKDYALALRTCLTFGLAMTLQELYLAPKTALLAIDEMTETQGHEPTLQLLLRAPEIFGVLKTNPRCAALPTFTPEMMRQMVVQLQMYRMLYVSLTSAR
jgi:hypothetical protein